MMVGMDVNPYESPRALPPAARVERESGDAPLTFIVFAMLVAIWLAAIAANIFQSL
jgi:hypothetical protein